MELRVYSGFLDKFGIQDLCTLNLVKADQTGKSFVRGCEGVDVQEESFTVSFVTSRFSLSVTSRLIFWNFPTRFVYVVAGWLRGRHPIRRSESGEIVVLVLGLSR